MHGDYILDTLLDRLWTRYCGRVEYAAQYAEMVEAKGGRVINDHIAFRTFNTNTGRQPPGVQAIARIFEPLGYVQKNRYDFETKKLVAWHWEHRSPDNPKIFISQLEVDKLPKETQKLINDTVADTEDLLGEDDFKVLSDIARGKTLDRENAQNLVENLDNFFNRPWNAPKRNVVTKVDKDSQYAAWTLLHGNTVNHFTAYINGQDVADWPDIEATIAALKNAGIPMKDELEGERGGKLRQSSTKAVMEQCDIIEDDGSTGKIEWSYAYYELAERGQVKDENGNDTEFTAFLGEQATNLFEMTKT